MTLPGVDSGPVTANVAGSTAVQEVNGYYLTDVTPNTAPPMNTLVYAPECRIIIARNNKEYDVSRDITAFSIRRPENSVASLVFSLSNKPISDHRNTELRYSGLFDRMDRIVCFLKRIKEVQVFSGYLDSVPLVQAFGGTVNFRASCTLKRLLYTYWDPGLPASAGIMDSYNTAILEQDAGESQADSGLGSIMRRLLQDVGGWPSDRVHIQKFPLGYINYMKQALERSQNPNQENLRQFRQMLLGDDTALGPGAAAGRTKGTMRGSYTNVDRPKEVIQTVDAMGMGPDNMSQAAAQGIQQASTGNTDLRSKQNWDATHEVGKNWNEAAQINDAAVHCFMVISVESGWKMQANAANPESLTFPHDAEGKDHDSIGLYQQRPNWGTTAQRMNVAESTSLFLQALNRIQWRNMDRGTACANVQNPAAQYRYRYGEFEQWAIEEVKGLRGNGATNPPGQTNSVTTAPTTGAQALNTGSVPGVGAVIPGATPAVPVTNGKPTAQAATAAVTGQHPAEGAIGFGRTQLNKPYQWGGNGPDTYDCSGLVRACYASVGVSLPRTSEAMLAEGVAVPAAQAQPGDLVFPDSGHVTMYTGNGMILEAQGDGVPVHEVPIWFNPSTATWKHYDPITYSGAPSAPFNAAPWGDETGVAPNTTVDGPNNTTVQSGSSEEVARNLYAYMFEPGKFISYISYLYGGPADSSKEKAFINDESLIHTVAGVCTASMRNFMSAPNGDFLAYYPDYFGLDGKQAVVNIKDVELKDLHIDLNDDALATHVYVGGTPNPFGASTGIVGWLLSQGYITVENEWVFQRMKLAAPRIKGDKDYTGQQMLKRFGMRPNQQEVPWLQTGAAEYLAAMQIFMTKWAQQYSTVIDICFMPEIFPGMRIQFDGHNLQAYVTEVVHSGDYTNGFTTQCTIMAPSIPNLARLLNEVSFADRNTNRYDATGTSTTYYY